MTPSLLLSLRQDVSAPASAEGDSLTLQGRDGMLTLKQVPPGLMSAIQDLRQGGAILADLTQRVEQDATPMPVLRLYRYLHRFAELGWLCHSAIAAGTTIATAIPLVPEAPLPEAEFDPGRPYALSRFAYCRAIVGHMVLESPRSKLQVRLVDPRGLALLALLATPQTCQHLSSQVPDLSQEAIEDVVRLLLGTHMLTQADPEGHTSEQANLPLTQWEFHDLLFHSRTRLGRSAGPFGGNYRFKGDIEPLPALKPPATEDLMDLNRPDVAALKATDPTFADVLESRQSMRQYGPDPITLQQLGEFLFRVARVKSALPSEHGDRYPRPYPNGGGTYELEFYLAVDTCTGLSTGLYHYQPLTHQLCRLTDRTPAVEKLLHNAARLMVQPHLPQVLVIISARFQRLAWAYQSVAYALMLKHVGVLQQTFYLAATAMGLAPCALGSGDSDLFAEAIGSDYYVETSIGEFALGSRPA